MNAAIIFGLFILLLAILDVAIGAIALVAEWSKMSLQRTQEIQKKLADLVAVIQNVSLRLDTSLNTLTTEVDNLETAIIDGMADKSEKQPRRK